MSVRRTKPRQTWAHSAPYPLWSVCLLLTSVRLSHVCSSYKAQVAGAAVWCASVSGRQAYVKLITVHRLCTVDREIAAGGMDRVDPDLQHTQA